MAQALDARAVLLNQYFANEFGFQHERQIVGNIIYKRVNQNNIVERIVVKFPTTDSNQWAAQDIDTDAATLVKLWGSEHNLRILSIPRGNTYGVRREPINRPLSDPTPIVPWWLQVDPQVYGNHEEFGFFVTEYLVRGTGCVEIQTRISSATKREEISKRLVFRFSAPRLV